MSRPLLVLGAGEDQVPVYREAARRGLPTIGVDMSTDRPGVALADEFLPLSTRDHEAIAQALAGREIAGVASAASDACLQSIHVLSGVFGTPQWISHTAAVTSMDKAAFRRLMTAIGVPGPAWTAGQDLVAVAAAAAEFSMPVVAKPVDASGSRGTQLVTDSQLLPEALAYAAAGSLSGTVIVEEYVPGRNVTVELFMAGGEPGFLTVTEKRMADRRNFVINGHRCPADLPAAVRHRLEQESARISLAMEVRDGPVNLDFIISPRGIPVVLEAGARVGGNGFPALVRAMSDVDTIAAVVSLAIGEPFDVRPKADRHAMLHVMASPHRQPLRLTVADGADRARALPGVAFAEFYLRPGQTVHPFTCSANKIGYVAVVGDDHAEAQRTLDLALAQINIEFDAPVGVVQ